jgi:hypothetical protein
VRRRLRTKAARHIALLPLVVLAVIVVWTLTPPLGFASLPDQTWLGGLWDAADDDDAILEVQSTIGTVETFVDSSTHTPLVPIWFTPLPLVTAAVPAPFPPNQTRAPPVV